MAIEIIKKNYTIREIAEMAGVSRGTVDRVLHGRGTVSEETERRVNAILSHIDYKPNFLAQSLKKGAMGRIAVLFPDSSLDVFWKRAAQGIEEIKDDYSFIELMIDTFFFNPNESSSFTDNCELILKDSYDGILLAPFFYRESLDFTRKCDQAGIPYVFFNTDVNESNPICFVGQNLVESGRTAARLMQILTSDDDKVAVLHLDEDISNARHMQEKENGFKEYFISNDYPNEKVIVQKIEEIAQIEIRLGDLFLKEDDLKGLFVSTSKVHYVAEFLQESHINARLIGYDFLSANINYLKEGVIDFLLFQHPLLQSKQALSILIEALIFNKEVESKRILPTDIIIKENVDSFLIGL